MKKSWMNVRPHSLSDRCLVAPHPDIADAIREDLQKLRESAGNDAAAARLAFQQPRAFGFDDGAILPPDEFALGTPFRTMSMAAAARSPLRGNLNVVVVLVDFADRQFATPASHFEELFFSTGRLAHGSVHEYYQETSGGLVGITGQVVGPIRLPQPLATYANGASGTGATPNAQTMARDTVAKVLGNVDFSQLDNDGNGFVDAFIIIHAGSGAEQTRSNGDIWSHKWVLDGGPIVAPGGVRVFAYLTVPEDCRVGVCAHELGHLLFGWPDLYDTDGSSEGIGNWCLMAAGSWNTVDGAAAGDVPAHPSAWYKASQGWVNVVTQRQNGGVRIREVQASHTVHRLWKDGSDASTEYFLAENRQKRGFDAGLPGDGLLVWHIDDSIDSNKNEAHYKVALLQADGRRDLERARNRGDAGDPFPGAAHGTRIDATTTPSTNSYSGLPTSVVIANIPQSQSDMEVDVQVTTVPTTRRRHASLPPAGPRVRADEGA